MQPNRRFLLADPAHFVALGFGSGLWPKGPGTAGTLAGWLLFPFVKAPLSDPLFGALLVAVCIYFVLGMTPAFLSISGTLIWLDSRQQRRRTAVPAHAARTAGRATADAAAP